jgi:hypothetical protein
MLPTQQLQLHLSPLLLGTTHTPLVFAYDEQNASAQARLHDWELQDGNARLVPV